MDHDKLDKLKCDLDELRREVQELKSQQLESASHLHRLEGRLVGLNEMIERRGQPV
jgi:hypothetical protein